MTNRLVRPAALVGMLAAASISLAQQPPDVVNSDSSGNTAMGSSAMAGCILTGCNENTAAGKYALESNTSGGSNVAVGYSSMSSNQTGTGNTAVGASSMVLLGGSTPASYSTAVGFFSQTKSFGSYNTSLGAWTLTVGSGTNNTALGYYSQVYATGGYNTSTGAQTLPSSTGGYNTADGYEALQANTSGTYNQALGYEALLMNQSGGYNTASGAAALLSNVAGNYNTAYGVLALAYSTASSNTAVGFESLLSDTSGANNIALGYGAGENLTTGSNDIYIGSPGGGASESGVIRIGSSGVQQSTYVQGIYGAAASGGAAVYVLSNGQLGTVQSSGRYKKDVQAMGERTRRLDLLRPVTFTYRSDPSGALQYGLIAEEVADVYPELVVRDGDGRIESVRYEELAPMLLNEVQQLRHTVDAQAQVLAGQQGLIDTLRGQQAQLVALHEQLAAMQQRLDGSMRAAAEGPASLAMPGDSGL
jgi:hypothetical protein